MKNTHLTLILQSLVLFPNQEVKLELKNELSKEIVDQSLKNYKNELIIISPKDSLEIRPDIKDLPRIGTFCEIKNSIELPNGTLRVSIRGVKRVKLKNFKFKNNNMIITENEPIINPPYNLDEENAYLSKLKNLINRYVTLNSKVSNSIIGIIKNVTNLSKLTDMIGASLDFSHERKCNLLFETNYYKRAHILITLLSNELKSLELENKIEEEVCNNFAKSERDIIIREKKNRRKTRLSFIPIMKYGQILFSKSTFKPNRSDVKCIIKTDLISLLQNFGVRTRCQNLNQNIVRHFFLTNGFCGQDQHRQITLFRHISIANEIFFSHKRFSFIHHIFAFKR